ncbi:hypothetical protein [Polluticoccus soli]|uniref:hypothetical protein n=1 Tax=Polluticoccus soli TaxID=3034150 RepID=UPI0023E1BC20|nr:hypothetical protein [Flavipsychrobacter sp. JY13-12]
MKKLSLTWPLALLFILTSFLSACSKDEDDPEPTPTNTTKYWEMGVEGGNFSINTKDLVLYDDGVSVNYNNYYVMQTSLPTSDFEYYGLAILVPNDPSLYSVDVSGVSAIVSHAGGETGNVYTSGKYVDQIELKGETYLRYKLEMRDQLLSADANTFHNVVTSMTVKYTNKSTGALVNSRNVKVEVYVRD